MNPPEQKDTAPQVSRTIELLGEQRVSFRFARPFHQGGIPWCLSYSLLSGNGGQTLRVAVLINDQRSGARRQDLQGFQELDHLVLLLSGEGIKGLSLGEGFAIVGFNSFPGGSELPMMHERTALIVEAPQLACNEFAVPREESRRSLPQALGAQLSSAIATDLLPPRFDIS
jgi:hypothetical protein